MTPMPMTELSQDVFHGIYTSKKRSLIMFLASYTLLQSFVLSSLDWSIYLKILFFLSFGLSVFIDGILSLRQYKEFWKLSHEFYDTLEDREKSIAQIKKLMQGADTSQLGDSIMLANQGLLESVRESGGSGAFKRFEVNGEFDALLLLKRKSLPLDEIIEILHKSDHL